MYIYLYVTHHIASYLKYLTEIIVEIFAAFFLPLKSLTDRWL